MQPRPISVPCLSCRPEPYPLAIVPEGALASSKIGCRQMRRGALIRASWIMGLAVAAWAAQLAAPSAEAHSRDPIHRLGSSAARDYMRSVLNGIGYEARAGGSIKCNRRLSAARRACKMGWVTGDTGFVGRGQIWLTFRRHEKQAHFSYRLTVVDEYCLYVTHEGNCTSKKRNSGPVPG